MDHAVDVVSQDAADGGAAAGRHLLQYPVLGDRAQPRLGDRGEADAAAVTEDPHVPDVLGLFGDRVGQRHPDLLLERVQRVLHLRGGRVRCLKQAGVAALS